MARQGKDYKYLSIKLDRKIAEALEQFTSETQLSKTAAVERALRMYLEHYDRTKKI